MPRGTVLKSVATMLLVSCMGLGAHAQGSMSARGGSSPAAPERPRAPSTSPAKPARATAASPVNLNSASAQQLQTLPNVGAATAARIIEYRQKNGGFKKIEDLMNVKGIGEKTFLKLKPLVTVGASRTGQS